MTAELSWHVQNFVAISFQGMELQLKYFPLNYEGYIISEICPLYFVIVFYMIYNCCDKLG